MKITFLGTGAADWKPEDWAKEGVFVRRLTCAQLNGDAVIDCGPTFFDSVEKANADISGVKFVFSTHLHRDHFNLDTLAQLSQDKEITFVCPASAAYATESLPQIKVIPLNLFEETKVGDYLVTAIPSSHVVAYHKDSQPVHYIIKHGDKTLFWGCDGCWISCQSWQYLRTCQFDMAVIDSTFGDYDDIEYLFEHNNTKMVEALVTILRAQGILPAHCLVYANHIAKICNSPHEVLVERYGKSNIGVTYDGLVVEL